MHQNNKTINVTLVKSNGAITPNRPDESNVDLHDRSEIFNNHQQIQNRPDESIFESQNRLFNNHQQIQNRDESIFESQNQLFNNHQQIQNRPDESIFESQNRLKISEVDIEQKQPRALFDMLLETIVIFLQFLLSL